MEVSAPACSADRVPSVPLQSIRWPFLHVLGHVSEVYWSSPLTLSCAGKVSAWLLTAHVTNGTLRLRLDKVTSASRSRISWSLSMTSQGLQALSMLVATGY